LAFVNSARMAKFGQFELQADRTPRDLSSMSLREMMLTNLSPRDVGLLLKIYREKRWLLRGERDRQRVLELRDRGWLTHDQPHLGDSSEVRLTPDGLSILETVVPTLTPVATNVDQTLPTDVDRPL
jgi:hypothetical protein